MPSEMRDSDEQRDALVLDQIVDPAVNHAHIRINDKREDEQINSAAGIQSPITRSVDGDTHAQLSR